MKDKKEGNKKNIQWQPKNKFKTRILKIFLLITLVPLFIISISNLFIVIKTRQSNIAELQSLAMRNAEEKIVKFLSEKSIGLNLVVSAPLDSIKEMDMEDLLFLLVNSYNSSQPRSLDFIDVNGRIIAQVRPNGTIVYNEDFLEKVEYGRFILSNIYSKYETRERVNSISSIESEVAASADFTKARQGENYIGPLEFIENIPVMRMAAPIKNQNEEVIGVVSAEISLAKLDQIISSIELGKAGYLYAIDNSGTIIASKNKKFARVGESVKDIPLVAKVLNGEAYNGLEEFIYYTSNLNQRVVFSSQAVEPINWYVISEWPIRDAFSVIGNIIYFSLFISLASLFLVGALAIFFTRQIIKPIKALDKGAREIAKGNMDWKIKLYTNDEFELLSRQFNKMTEVLKDNQRLRDEFVFISAHELRTPVTATKGYLSMLLDGSFGKVPKKFVDPLKIVYTANERLVQLVHDLLEIARTEAGKMKIAIKSVGMAENIKQVINELKSLQDEKGIIVNYQEADNDYQVQADPDKLKEVLINIIGNAIKYTTKGGDINISHEVRDAYLITHIKDQGIGMSKEETSKLFSKFYRAQNEDTAKIEGTGLGLFICKEIVERMNGEIWVESEKGKGSTFSFRLGRKHAP
ncbi:sensor histidine kinase [Candidatus Parcubacteria bacterium]|nr:sensor histidine kinase [Candidatus Parcubacteria bacterium]